MSLFRFVCQSIRYHGRLHLGLLAGAVVACAVLTGALVVGVSVRNTLRHIADARLGDVAHALDWGNRFLQRGLVDELREHAGKTTTLSGVLTLRGVLEPSLDRAASVDRVNRAHVYGVDDAFFGLAQDGADIALPGAYEAHINEEVARRLGLAGGDDFILRLSRPSAMPLDAPLARGGESDTVVARMRVLSIVTEAQLGRFSLSADQAMPANVFVNGDWLAALVDMPDRVNLLLADGGVTRDELQAALTRIWQPEHAGLRLRAHSGGTVQVESERVFIEPAVAQALTVSAATAPMLTWLVNHIAAGDRSTPYSFVTAGAAPVGIPDGAVGVSQWLADYLGVGPGDTVDLAWLEPLPSNVYEERRISAPVHCVIPMDALGLERELSPVFPGLTDVDTCRDWDIGLPLEEEQLLDADNEAYWKTYGQTPKLIVSFPTGKDWWGSRFGSVMTLRFVDGTTDIDAARTLLRSKVTPEMLGLIFAPIAEEAQQSVDGAMDFGPLFIGMSFFLIAAAITLLALLYAHGLQTRAGEVGTLLAVGLTSRRVTVLFVLESLPTIVLGAVMGALGGDVYARLLLRTLTLLWPDAVAGTPLRHWHAPGAMAQGALISLLVALLVVIVCVHRAGRRPVRELLQRDYSGADLSRRGGLRPVDILMLLFGALVPITVFLAFQAGPGERASWFFVTGLATLCFLFTAYRCILGVVLRLPSVRRPRLWRLSMSQLARRRGRTLGVAVITGCGVFILVSATVMQAATSFQVELPQSGAGGFSVFATAVIPLRHDDGRLLGLPESDVVPLRVWDGDDAGCLNLNRARRPRIFGVNPELLIARGAFASSEDVEALWSALKQPLPDGVVPALVGDADTALWGLQAKLDAQDGSEFDYRNDDGLEVRLRAVGSLPMRLSLFQGALVIDEAAFTRLFPHQGGYRAFLVDAADASEGAMRLNRDYGRLGMDATPSVERLRAFHAVERAYLSMFMVLGGLGMMVGAGGATILALRNLHERRGEFAVMLAIGFTRRMLLALAFFENLCLMLAGIIMGFLASAVATFPLRIGSDASLNAGGLFAVLTAVAASYLVAAITAALVGLHRVSLDALRSE